MKLIEQACMDSSGCGIVNFLHPDTQGVRGVAIVKNWGLSSIEGDVPEDFAEQLLRNRESAPRSVGYYWMKYKDDPWEMVDIQKDAKGFFFVRPFPDDANNYRPSEFPGARWVGPIEEPK